MFDLGTRESPWFAEICLPFLGRYCLHCFALHSGLRNFEFPRRTKAQGRRSLITKSKYFTYVVTVSVVIRRIIIQTQTQKIPRARRRFLGSAHLARRISKLICERLRSPCVHET